MDENELDLSTLPIAHIQAIDNVIGRAMREAHALVLCFSLATLERERYAQREIRMLVQLAREGAAPPVVVVCCDDWPLPEPLNRIAVNVTHTPHEAINVLRSLGETTSRQSDQGAWDDAKDALTRHVRQLGLFTETGFDNRSSAERERSSSAYFKEMVAQGKADILGIGVQWHARDPTELQFCNTLTGWVDSGKASPVPAIVLESALFRASHPRWRDDALMRRHVLDALMFHYEDLLHGENAKLAPVTSAVLEDLVGVIPFSMRGASSQSLHRSDARVINLRLAKTVWRARTSRARLEPAVVEADDVLERAERQARRLGTYLLGLEDTDVVVALEPGAGADVLIVWGPYANLAVEGALLRCQLLRSHGVRLHFERQFRQGLSKQALAQFDLVVGMAEPEEFHSSMLQIVWAAPRDAQVILVDGTLSERMRALVWRGINQCRARLLGVELGDMAPEFFVQFHRTDQVAHAIVRLLLERGRIPSIPLDMR